MKDNPRPWLFLDNYRDVEFEGQWPNLAQMFHITVMRYPDRPCWSCFGKDEMTLTFREAEKKVIEIAVRLTDLGVEKGCHVGVSGRNSPQWALAFMGIVYAGAVVVPLDNSLSEEELENLTMFGDVEWFFGDIDRIKKLEGRMKGLFSLERESEYEYVMDMCGRSCEYRTTRSQEANGDDLAAILFTSGTMGNPKGVMLTHDNLVSCCFQAQRNMNAYCTDVFYAILPIHHAYTLQAIFIESMSFGAHVIFGKRLVVKTMLSDMKRGNVTMFLGVPMLFNKLYKGLMDGVKKKGRLAYAIVHMGMGISGFMRDVLHINVGKRMFRGLLDKVSLADIRICISGGGPLPAVTLKGFHKMGLDFVQGYGLTETSPITHLNPIYAFVQESVGKIIPPYEQKIVNPDEDGNGLIYLRGSCVMKGYYKNEEATREVLSEDGWLNTGDVGHVDAKGYLYLTGRAKNVIVLSGGKNVFPEEIEDMFQMYTELEQVCIVSYETADAVSEIGIMLLALPSEALVKECGNEDEVRSRLEGIVSEVNTHLPHYKKISRTVILSEALPTTSTKKIKRAEVYDFCRKNGIK